MEGFDRDAGQARERARASVAGVLVNAGLTAMKLIAGWVAHSDALLSDAVHSLSDVLTTIVVLIGCRMAEKGPDEAHPGGHMRVEYIAGLLFAGVLFVTGLGIGVNGVKQVWSGADSPPPGLLALAVAVLSVVIKLLIWRYTWLASRRTASPLLAAAAKHHLLDAFSSFGAVLGIAGARLGVPVLDPAAGVLISVMIAKTALDIFRENADRLINAADGT